MIPAYPPRAYAWKLEPSCFRSHRSMFCRVMACERLVWMPESHRKLHRCNPFHPPIWNSPPAHPVPHPATYYTRRDNRSYDSSRYLLQ
jgi:hypothetical protein